MSNNVRITASMDDNVSKKLGLIGQKFDKHFGKGSSASFFGNVGAKGVAAGFGLIDRALSAAFGALGDAVQGAMEDEKSVAQLNAALKANVKGWDGNTTAIENNITAKMRLGFTDEEQRHSMSLLVAATNDVSKSQDLMSTAMDLARLKGISLEEASTALIKVDDGHYRALQALGIKLGDNATSTEALAAVQAAANGQAETYAKTTGGKLLASQIKVGEAMEKIGYEIMPAVSEALTFLSDTVVPALVPVLEGLIGTVKGLAAAWELVDYWIRTATGNQKKMIEGSHLKGGGVITGQQQGGSVPHGKHAEGGWVGLHGPEIGLLGERGPEFIRKAGTGTGDGGGGGFTIQGVSEGDVLEMIDRGLFFRLRRAAPVNGRV